MKAVLSAAALAAAAALAFSAAPAPAQKTATERISRLIVYGNDPCPRDPNGDIVICGRRPDSERYRIPEALRDDTLKDDPASTSWAQHAQSLEYVGRTGIQSCSTVGPGGFTGCWAELMRAARNDRRTEGEPGR
jgi:hypothetical protein